MDNRNANNTDRESAWSRSLNRVDARCGQNRQRDRPAAAETGRRHFRLHLLCCNCVAAANAGGSRSSSSANAGRAGSHNRDVGNPAEGLRSTCFRAAAQRMTMSIMCGIVDALHHDR
jgi:hypothetical protein